MTEFICVFTTGRTGTALLTQLFSGVPWQKGGLVAVQGVDGIPSVVGHEGWQLPIQAVKQHGPDGSILTKRITQALQPNGQRLLMTDNRVGRFYGPILDDLDISTKIIYLTRDTSAVVDSFMRRVEHRKAQRSAKEFQRYCHTIWDRVLYHPTDRDTLIPYPVWITATMEQKFIWYCQEAQARWHALKGSLQSPYIEVAYEQLNEDDTRKKLTTFTGIEYHPELFSHVVNES